MNGTVADDQVDDQLRRRLAEACWILALEGQEHFDLGHVSTRQASTARYWVKPSGLGLGEVSARDMVLVDLEGHKLAGERAIHRELPIHAEIYRARPDVACVVHTHPFHAAAFSAAAAEFKMLGQDSILFADGIGRYDSALLVVTPGQGRALVAALGDGSIVVMRNHGIVVAAASVELAIVLAVSFERSLRIQLAVGQSGPLEQVPLAEVEEMAAQFRSPLAAGSRPSTDTSLAALRRADGHRLSDATEPRPGRPSRRRRRRRRALTIWRGCAPHRCDPAARRRGTCRGDRTVDRHR
jgi:L-fuculose-phosphate aldolase